MNEEFRAEVERFAQAVQQHILNELLMDWLFLHMPRPKAHAKYQEAPCREDQTQRISLIEDRSNMLSAEMLTNTTSMSPS